MEALEPVEALAIAASEFRALLERPAFAQAMIRCAGAALSRRRPAPGRVRRLADPRPGGGAAGRARRALRRADRGRGRDHPADLPGGARRLDRLLARGGGQGARLAARRWARSAPSAGKSSCSTPRRSGASRPDARDCTHGLSQLPGREQGGGALLPRVRIARSTLACPSCGAPHDPGQAFCDQCGSPLDAAPPRPAPSGGPELRVASVLFVDLVGYTPLSESRDVEDVRDLLSRYFDLTRTVVDRYGGTVEKFIGDAVMAVWGVPVARGDDAERAVRAGLELVDAVSRFGESVGRARPAGARGRRHRPGGGGREPGRGAGDRRPGQYRLAGPGRRRAPGTVYVDAATRQGASAAVAFEDAGEHSVKGKAEPLRLYRALRVVGGAAGTRLRTGLEPPFVGRAAELRLIKDLFHASVDRQRRAPGRGQRARRGRQDQARDRVRQLRRRARGRGALALRPLPRVRRRGRLLGARRHGPPAARDRRGHADGRGRLAARRRARALGRRPRPSASGSPRRSGRCWAPPSRGWCARSCSRPGGCSSSGSPTAIRWCLLFEDMHWADEGLLDFLEQLLDWSGEHPIFVCCFARPELSERRPGWPTGVANATALTLEPLGARRDRRAARRHRLRPARAAAAADRRRTPRACRCTRSRPSGRWPTAACSPSARTGSRRSPRSASSRCRRACTRCSRRDSTRWRRPSASWSARWRSSGPASRAPARRRSRGCPRTASTRCSPRSSVARSSRSPPARSRPSAASTRSHRACCARSPTR